MTHRGGVGERTVSCGSGRLDLCWIQRRQAEVCWERAQPLTKCLTATWWNRKWMINSLPSGSLFTDACLLVELCDTLRILLWWQFLPPSTAQGKSNQLFFQVDITTGREESQDKVECPGFYGARLTHLTTTSVTTFNVATESIAFKVIVRIFIT